MRSYIKRILGRFVKPAVIKRCVDICSIKYTDVENQLTGMLSYRLNSIQLLYVYTCKAKYNVDKNNINVNKVDTILCLICRWKTGCWFHHRTDFEKKASRRWHYQYTSQEVLRCCEGFFCESC